jgi:hypothetical protein
VNVLENAERPELIGQWISGGRRNSPIIKDLANFSTVWKRWWAKLQPESRQGRKLLRVVNVGEEWESLEKGGINGFFNVVASLSWWVVMLNTSAERKVFAEVASDVSWVLDKMIKNLKNSREHGTAAEEGEDRSKR